jgi:hypothetical protein
VQFRQLKVGSRLLDQRGRHQSRIQREPYRQKGNHDPEKCQRQENSEFDFHDIYAGTATFTVILVPTFVSGLPTHSGDRFLRRGNPITPEISLVSAGLE